MRCVLLVGQVLVAVAAFAIDPVDWVDTRYGSDPGLGTCVIGPCLPHGSSHPSPDSVWPAPNRPAEPGLELDLGERLYSVRAGCLRGDLHA